MNAAFGNLAFDAYRQIETGIVSSATMQKGISNEIDNHSSAEQQTCLAGHKLHCG